MKLLFDFLPLLLFFGAFMLYDIYVAAATAIIASLLQVSLYWLRYRKFEKIHLASLAIVTFMGGLTLALHDKSFVMWKPTAINWLFALVFLASHFIGKKPMIQRAFSAMEDQFTLPDNMWARFNAAWIALFFAAGAINIYIVKDYQAAESALRTAVPNISQQQIDKFTCETDFSGTAQQLCREAAHKERLWLYFKVPGMIGLTLLLMFVQLFFMMRFMKPDETPNNNSKENSP